VAAAPNPLPAPPIISATGVIAEGSHLTDDQDRLGSGKLKANADHRAQANALYAQATLLSEGTLNDQQQASDLYHEAVELDPGFVDARIHLANLLLQAGKPDEALAQLQSAAAHHPDSIPVQVALGYTQRLRGENDEAERLCKHALTVDPNQPAAMRVLLEVAADQDDLAGGVLHIEDILKNAGSDVPASSWMTLARLYVEVARGERTPPSNETMLQTQLPMLQQAVAQSAPDFATLTLLGDTYQQLGRKAEALHAYRRARALDPSDLDVVLSCAELENDLGDISQAIDDYETATALNPSVPGLRERLCSLYVDEGIAEEQSHHPEKAQACFQKVFDSVACPPEAYLKLAFYQIEHHELKQASETLASAQTHFPTSARIRYYQAIENRYAKDYTAALSCLDQVKTLASGAEATVLDVDYYLESALTLNLAEQKDKLEGVLREGLAKFPDNAELMNELAYYWADQGHHLPEALALSQRAVALEPDNGPILDTLGWVYFKMGQPKDALPYLQRAAIMTNNDPVVLQHVGDTYLKLGLRHEAIATWTRALEKDPGNGELAGRINAAQAQANNVHTRSAPTP
jgi:tetratricopeptide (TPR) repeat protein